MNYRLDKYGNKLSILGFGCMRFQRKLGRIDLEEAEREILLAYENGVNYYDTAYIYPGSEAAIGEIFERNGIREKIHIATKLPHYLIRSRSAMDKLFEEELKRLRTDYVDYYLMHMLNDVNSWERLKELGIEDWIAEKKASGAIRQVGFSYHGNSEVFCQIVDAYDWDFCQIQYNYLDEHTQAGRKGLYHASSKGIPVMVFNPHPFAAQPLVTIPKRIEHDIWYIENWSFGLDIRILFMTAFGGMVNSEVVHGAKP